MKLLEQLQQLMPLAAAATDGPWFIYSEAEGDESGLTGYNNMVVPQPGAPHDEDGKYNDIATTGEDYDNAAFIAAARNLLTRDNLTLLVAALQAARTAQKDLDALRSMLCGIGVVGGIDGWPVIRRDSVIELIDQFRHV